jgi:hypothetical protein
VVQIQRWTWGHGHEFRRSISEANFSSKLLIDVVERVRGFIGATEELVGLSCSPNFTCSVEMWKGREAAMLLYINAGREGNDRGSM